MATMIPAQWQDVNGSHAEALIYKKLRGETPEDWFAIHSVGLAAHRSKPIAEADFVVIGPFGVLCLEVKGGVITVDQGRWFTNDSKIDENPFKQAGGEAAALYSELSRLGSVRRTVVGHGVLFPDTLFDKTGPDIDETIVYDERDLETPIRAYLQRVADKWLGFHGRAGDGFRPLSRSERTELVNAVAPSFTLTPSLRARMTTVEAELVELTKEQARVLRGMQTEERAFIRGGAGTGKTLLAVEEAARLAREGRRTLICVRARNLAGFISERIEEPGVDVVSYEELLRDLVREAGLEARLPDAAPEDLLGVFLPELAVEAILELDRGDGYEALVVDEAQDLLVEAALEVWDLLLSGGLAKGTWRVFLDHKQNVFSAVDRGQLERITAAATTRYTLVDNCRNTPQISETTCMLSAVDPDATLAGEGPDVEMRFVLDRAEEAKAAAATVANWLRRGVESNDIVVVAADDLALRRLQTYWPAGGAALTRFDTPRPGAIRVVEVSDFKGLEAAAVVVVGARELHELDTLRRMYVACSRARVLLAVVLDEDARADFNTRAAEYARRRAN